VVVVVCPECGFPVEDDSRVIAARRVKCDNCAWTGDSSKLIEVLGGSTISPDVFRQLFLHISRVVSPSVAAKMLQLGLISEKRNAENLKSIASILRAGSRGMFEGIVRAMTEKSDE
jgi:hypothetical protein